jgi:hypothetical protein
MAVTCPPEMVAVAVAPPAEVAVLLAESVTVKVPILTPGVVYDFDKDAEVPVSPSVPVQLYVYPVPLPPFAMAFQTTEADPDARYATVGEVQVATIGE